MSADLPVVVVSLSFLTWFCACACRSLSCAAPHFTSNSHRSFSLPTQVAFVDTHAHAHTHRRIFARAQSLPTRPVFPPPSIPRRLHGALGLLLFSDASGGSRGHVGVNVSESAGACVCAVFVCVHISVRVRIGGFLFFLSFAWVLPCSSACLEASSAAPLCCGVQWRRHTHTHTHLHPAKRPSSLLLPLSTLVSSQCAHPPRCVTSFLFVVCVLFVSSVDPPLLCVGSRSRRMCP